MGWLIAVHALSIGHFLLSGPVHGVARPQLLDLSLDDLQGEARVNGLELPLDELTRNGREEGRCKKSCKWCATWSLEAAVGAHPPG